MTDRIIELLKAQGVDGFEITDKCTSAWEFYFIKHELDQNRVRDVEHIDVTVYRKLEDEVREKLGAKVNIIPKDEKKGKLEIEYFSQSELEEIVNKITGKANK